MLFRINTQVNPKAELDGRLAPITSVGLKSGTNQIHGSAYAFGRSDSFDRRNFFNHFNPDGTLQAKRPWNWNNSEAQLADIS